MHWKDKLISTLFTHDIIEYDSNDIKKCSFKFNTSQLYSKHHILSYIVTLLYNQFNTLFLSASTAKLYGLNNEGLILAALLSSISKCGVFLNLNINDEIVVVMDIYKPHLIKQFNLECKIKYIFCLFDCNENGIENKSVVKPKHISLLNHDDVIKYKVNTILSNKNYSLSPCNKYKHLLIKQKNKRNSSIILELSSLDNIKKLQIILTQISPFLAGVRIHNKSFKLSKKEHLDFYKMVHSFGLFVWEEQIFFEKGDMMQKYINFFNPIRDFISILPTQQHNNVEYKQLGIIMVSLFDDNSLQTQQRIHFCENNNISAVLTANPEIFPSDMITIAPLHCQHLLNKTTFILLGDEIVNAYDPIEEIKKFISKPNV